MVISNGKRWKMIVEKDYYILFSPVDYLNNKEVREIMKGLEKPTFFVMHTERMGM